MGSDPNRRRSDALLRGLLLAGAAVFFTALGCGTILLLGGRLGTWQIAAVAVTGVGGAIGVFGAWAALSPPDRW